MTHSLDDSHDDGNDLVRPEQAASVAGRSLPPPPRVRSVGKGGTILLFYQYKEPLWTRLEHKRMLKAVLKLATLHNVQGRGRVAPEGLNCTLSSHCPRSMREFCNGLRKHDGLFWQTDFKFTDNVPPNELFKSLSIRKTQELVAYGFTGPTNNAGTAGTAAPSLTQFAGQHVPANEFHRLLQQPDTVVVDVRNRYETALGSFSGLPKTATLIDPNMRHSSEFPKWLNQPTTKEQLAGKNVLMYCTGGIRCERATALLNQMSAADSHTNNRPRAVYELQGGIERYLKTYPNGGYWRGKNYLFDRRREQTAEQKSQTQVEQETESVCAGCLERCTSYQGKFKCTTCAVPVIVCKNCSRTSANDTCSRLLCDLCRDGVPSPSAPAPDMLQLKRKTMDDATCNTTTTELVQNDASCCERPTKRMATVVQGKKCTEDRLFVARLPLTVTKTSLASLLKEDIILVQWLKDKHTGAFYGSCIVQVESKMAADRVLGQLPIQAQGSKRKFKVAMALASTSCWPPAGYQETELPPIGNF